MQAETHHAIETIKGAIGLLQTHIDVAASKARLDVLMAQISNPDFWNDQETAQAVMQEKTYLENALASLAEIEDGLAEQLEMIALGEEEGDGDIVAEAEAEILSLAAIAEKKQLESLYQVRQTGIVASLKFIRALAVPKPKIGPPCSCECILVGQMHAPLNLK